MMKPVDLQNGYKPMKRRLHSKNMAGPGKALDILVLQDVDSFPDAAPAACRGSSQNGKNCTLSLAR